MNRRRFIQTSLVTSGLTAVAAPNLLAGSGSPYANREFYELRLYRLKPGAQREGFDRFMRQAGIPALNRHGISPVGVFNVTETEEPSADAYVLTRHASLDAYYTALANLQQDTDYAQAGDAFVNTPATDPAYVRVESALLVSIAGIPKLEKPSGNADGASRIFQLRIYESHSKKANLKKIEMFNIGELDIFRRTGLQPVFFGEALSGGRLPNLTYMLVFENMDACRKNWRQFVNHPDWKKLSKTPGFTDPEIVSNITNHFLKPAEYSQL